MHNVHFISFQIPDNNTSVLLYHLMSSSLVEYGQEFIEMSLAQKNFHVSIYLQGNEKHTQLCQVSNNCRFYSSTFSLPNGQWTSSMFPSGQGYFQFLECLVSIYFSVPVINNAVDPDQLLYFTTSWSIHFFFTAQICLSKCTPFCYTLSGTTNNYSQVILRCAVNILHRSQVRQKINEIQSTPRHTVNQIMVKLISYETQVKISHSL